MGGRCSYKNIVSTDKENVLCGKGEGKESYAMQYYALNKILMEVIQL